MAHSPPQNHPPCHGPERPADPATPPRHPTTATDTKLRLFADNMGPPLFHMRNKTAPPHAAFQTSSPVPTRTAASRKNRPPALPHPPSDSSPSSSSISRNLEQTRAGWSKPELFADNFFATPPKQTTLWCDSGPSFHVSRFT